MPNYQNGKIYFIWSPNYDKWYIGSTTESLNIRMTKHLSDYNKKTHRCCSEKLLQYGDCHIQLIEHYSCHSKTELNKREGVFQKRCLDFIVNKRIAGRTDYEYYTDNCEMYRKKSSDWRINNQDCYKKYRIDNAVSIAATRLKYNQAKKIELLQNETTEERTARLEIYNARCRELYQTTKIELLQNETIEERTARLEKRNATRRKLYQKKKLAKLNQSPSL